MTVALRGGATAGSLTGPGGGGHCLQVRRTVDVLIASANLEELTKRKVTRARTRTLYTHSVCRGLDTHAAQHVHDPTSCLCSLPLTPWAAPAPDTAPDREHDVPAGQGARRAKSETVSKAHPLRGLQSCLEKERCVGTRVGVVAQIVSR